MTAANWTLRHFFEALSSLSGVKPPTLKLPASVTGFGARALRLDAADGGLGRRAVADQPGDGQLLLVRRLEQGRARARIPTAATRANPP